MGAFWVAVRILLCHHHEGRGQLRVGRRVRVGFEAAVDEVAAGGTGPAERVEVLEQLAQAADLMAGLDDVERRVVVAMAVDGAGVRRVAKLLGVPVASVKAAVRSADEKLQKVAVVAAAGRMCGYRTSVIAARARGSASEEQLRAAHAHLVACESCRRSYVLMARELRGSGLKRRGALAFVPLPPIVIVRPSLRHLLDRLPLLQGIRDRAAEAFGGIGVLKALAASSAVIVATTTVAVGLHKALEHPCTHGVHRYVRAYPLTVAGAWRDGSRDMAVVARVRTDAHVRAGLAANRRSQARKEAVRAAYREFSFEGTSTADPGRGGSARSTAIRLPIERSTRAVREFTFEHATP